MPQSLLHPQLSWISYYQVSSGLEGILYCLMGVVRFLVWGEVLGKDSRCQTGSQALYASHELNKGVVRAVALLSPSQGMLGARSELHKWPPCLRKAGLSLRGGQPHV